MANDLNRIVENRPTPRGLFELLGLFSENPSVSGFQRAHIAGAGFVSRPTRRPVLDTGLGYLLYGRRRRKA